GSLTERTHRAAPTTHTITSVRIHWLRILMTRSATHGYGHPESGRIAVIRSCQSRINLSPFPDQTAERTSQAQNRQRRIYVRVGRRRTGAILSREPGTLGSAFWGATAVSFSKRVDGQFNGLNFGLL